MNIQTPTIRPTPFTLPPVILVVDASGDALDTLCEGISAAGYIAIPARSACEAARCLEFAIPDAILLDAASPEIKGFELGRRIKSMPIWNRVPILFMIEPGNTKQIVDSYENGGTDYVSKPLQVPEVIARLFTCTVTHVSATQ